MVTQEKQRVGDLKKEETLERKDTEVVLVEPSREMSFADLMNPEFIAQFKGCWRW